MTTTVHTYRVRAIYKRCAFDETTYVDVSYIDNLRTARFVAEAFVKENHPGLLDHCEATLLRTEQMWMMQPVVGVNGVIEVVKKVELADIFHVG